MNDATAQPLVSDAGLDRLFRKARSFNDFTAQPVTDVELRAIYDLMKWGPTTANCQPQRVLFVRSAEAKAKLEPALSSQNKKKTLGAPVVALARWIVERPDWPPLIHTRRGFGYCLADLGEVG